MNMNVNTNEFKCSDCKELKPRETSLYLKAFDSNRNHLPTEDKYVCKECSTKYNIRKHH